jgi:FtsH-binding integral membrane protein
MEQPLNEQGSLQLIESMIKKAKNNFSESGTLYLVWGIAIFICSITQFIASYFYHYDHAYYVWFITWLVFIYQIIFIARKKKRIRVKTYTDEILGYVWICFIACMFILMFILQYNKAFNLINSVILVLYGIPTFLSGAILKVKPLIFGGIGCWVLAETSIFIPQPFHILLISVAVLVAWIIPGMYMRKKFLKENAGNVI